ncbi:MAG: 4Fe-4S binding protein [Bacteriovoracaceae bacterium]|nr:4Fe-4S binding protein [Bacteriovoracaceae bacterium]
MILKNEYYKAKSLTLGVLKTFLSMSFDVVKRIYGIKKVMTIDYPTETYQYSPRLLGLPQLVLDSKGKSLCTSCMKCVEICPTNCLEVKGVEGKEPEIFNLDVGKCIFCSYCEDVCPDDAIKMSQEHILASHNEENLVLNFNELKSQGKRPEPTSSEQTR